MATEIWAILLVVIGTMVFSISPIWLKKASSSKFDIKSITKNYYLFGAVFCYTAGLAVFVVALKGGELSVLYPLASLSYVWACLLSVKMLGEKMTRRKWLALGIIILGAFFIGAGA